jgi:hypothetical protein
VAFLRFVVAQKHPDFEVSDGVFSTAYKLRDSAQVTRQERETLNDHLKWFTANLATPHRFNRSSSKGHYRRRPKGIAWFRDDASEHIARMYDIKRVLDVNGHTVDILRQDRVGYLVYQDEFQVVAEPFADTRTDG